MEKREIANVLLQVGAVALRPDEPFTWASGIQSPMYCDTRLTISEPAARKAIALGLSKLIASEFPNAQAVAGTATAGIPHAAWVAAHMELPMVYVRSKAKEHGRGNQIEGKIVRGQKMVVVEDIISTGGSSLQAVEALRAAGIDVIGVASVYTYGLARAQEAFQASGVRAASLTDFEALLMEAEAMGAVTAEQAPGVRRWYERLKVGALDA